MSIEEFRTNKILLKYFFKLPNMFPLYKNDGKPLISLSSIQIENIGIVKSKISKGIYVLTENKCLCWNQNISNDIIISEKDRYWFSIEQILCSKCWLIRSWKIFDGKSNQEFYEKEYRSIYVWSHQAPQDFFEDQISRWKLLLNTFETIVWKKQKSVVFEIGCWAGGVLFPWKSNWFTCAGCDFDENYLNFWTKKGLTLNYWDYDKIVDDNSIDIIILSHVMEHFLNPIKEIQRIIKKIRIWGYLIVEVPGIFYINKMYFDPILFFQNAHVFNYYYSYLKIFFEKLWLEVIYGDEKCTFILKKPDNYIEKQISEIYYESLSVYPIKILKYLQYCKKYMYFNPFYLAHKILTPLWLYKIVGNIYFKTTKFLWK